MSIRSVFICNRISHFEIDKFHVAILKKWDEKKLSGMSRKRNQHSSSRREAFEHWAFGWRDAQMQKSQKWKKEKNQTNRPSRTVSKMNNGQILHLHYPILVDSIYITCAHRSWLWWVFMYARVTSSLLFCFIIVLFTLPSRSTIHSFVASHWMALHAMAWHICNQSRFLSISFIETDVNNNHKYNRYSIEKMSSIRYGLVPYATCMLFIHTIHFIGIRYMYIHITILNK